MKTLKLTFSILLFLCVLSSCVNNTTFEGNYAFENSKWKESQIVRFNPIIKDSLDSFNMFITIRNTAEYENMNFWLFVTCTNPDGIEKRDTLNCILADKKGTWLGTGLGDIYDTRHLLKSNVKFPRGGEYEFSFVHAMRTKIVDGINDIGLSIEKIENK